MPVLIDLFCGRGGWTRAAMVRGWRCYGFDTVNHGYPGNLIERALPVDLETLIGLKPDLIVASPPCEEFARKHLPWISRCGPVDERLLRWSINLRNFTATPVIVECSKSAAREVPGARMVGPYALWGDVPVLMPRIVGRKMKRSGLYPSARAMIPDELAGWIIEVHTRRLESLHFALKGESSIEQHKRRTNQWPTQ